MNSLFTNKSKINGNIGIGKLPNKLEFILDNISTEYINNISDKSITTFHTYYKYLTGKIKENFDKIQHNEFWNNICDNVNKCIKYCITEMNEIYYSNPKPNFIKENLYGAAANLIPHRDCILYNFNKICFYRIIIGLTNYNNDVSTEFIDFNIKHKINKGDYIIFDFDKTLHQVTKLGEQYTARILLKLHYIVCEDCKYSNNYIKFISNFYKYYYYIARYTEQLGTDPKTFIGFFFGLIWEWPFYLSFRYIVFSLFIAIIIILNIFYKINFSKKNIGKILLYTLLDLFIIYLFIVFFFYIRYILFDIK